MHLNQTEQSFIIKPQNLGQTSWLTEGKSMKYVLTPSLRWSELLVLLLSTVGER